MKIQTKFHRVVDSTHSYTKVPVAELQRVGVADKITKFSFIKGNMAYLEEDTDLSTFQQARADEGKPITTVEIMRKNCSRIRAYSAYNPTVYKVG